VDLGWGIFTAIPELSSSCVVDELVVPDTPPSLSTAMTISRLGLRRQISSFGSCTGIDG